MMLWSRYYPGVSDQGFLTKDFKGTLRNRKLSLLSEWGEKMMEHRGQVGILQKTNFAKGEGPVMVLEQ